MQRLAARLGLTTQTDPVKIELELNPMVRRHERGALSLRLILHGRAVCKARKPACDACVLADICPSAFTLLTPAGEQSACRRTGS